MSVSEAARRIREALADAMPRRVRVVGEISNLSARQHWFFTLKDESAALRCVMFASAASKVSFEARDGMEVVASGRIDFYDAQGAVQLYVDRLEPVGLGELERRFRALCEALREAGYFDPAAKRPLPVMARRIAVVTSRSAAALQDVLDTARRRFPGCRLMLYPVRVQGEHAAGEVAAAIRWLDREAFRLELDAILITRGGGSIEDLWAFNERIVAEAIHEARLPVVAAIGHETDTTIAELVADWRAATPTQAAMQLVPDAGVLGEQLDQLARRMNLLVRRRIEQERRHVQSLAARPCLRRPAAVFGPLRARLEQAGSRLARALARRQEVHAERLDRAAARIAQAGPARLGAAGERLDALARHLEAVGPQRVLERGFSLTLDGQGRPVREASALAPGDPLTSVLARGRVQSVVAGAPRPAPRPAPRRRPRRRRGAETPPQPGLFD